jgi:hypothetical protein
VKSYTGSFNKYNLPSNNLKLKSILSILTIGIFIVLGFASIEEVAEVDCKVYDTPITKSHDIVFEFFDRGTGKPIRGEPINFVITEFKKNIDSQGCYIEFDHEYPENKVSDQTGKIALKLNETYISSDDETHIAFSFKNINYNEASLSLIVHVNDGSLTKRYEFLKIDLYP